MKIGSVCEMSKASICDVSKSVLNEFKMASALISDFSF